LKELVNHVGRGVRDNLCNLGVAVARFAGGTELRVGNVTTSFFFRRAPVPSFPGRSFLSVSGNAQLPVFRQGAYLPHMLRDRDCLLALRQGVRQLLRLGRPHVQELAARRRDGR
jgi:hypothetical protein